ncbi:hypothetical protein [Paenibacillus andongensis]
MKLLDRHTEAPQISPNRTDTQHDARHSKQQQNPRIPAMNSIQSLPKRLL